MAEAMRVLVPHGETHDIGQGPEADMSHHVLWAVGLVIVALFRRSRRDPSQ